jgi:N-acetylglucosaminyl-diphospho-decaprenol L-rhamnosyltransferase
MDLSISIVSWNTRRLLEDCLRSVYDTTDGIEFEVIVVDNASSDGSAEMTSEQFPQARLLKNDSNLGFSRANNRALEVSSGRYFMLLNSDTVCYQDSLAGMVRFLNQTPAAGAAGPMVLNPDGSLQYSWARFPSMANEVLGRLDRTIPGVPVPPRTVDDVANTGPFQTDWVGGCAMVLRKEAIEAVGPMDESLFMYCEETDWCRRLHDAGWQVWVNPCCRITHYGGASSARASDAVVANLLRSKSAYFTKHHGRAAGVLLRGALWSRYRAAKLARRLGGSN